MNYPYTNNGILLSVMHNQPLSYKSGSAGDNIKRKGISPRSLSGFPEQQIPPQQPTATSVQFKHSVPIPLNQPRNNTNSLGSPWKSPGSNTKFKAANAKGGHSDQLPSILHERGSTGGSGIYHNNLQRRGHTLTSNNTSRHKDPQIHNNYHQVKQLTAGYPQAAFTYDSNSALKPSIKPNQDPQTIVTRIERKDRQSAVQINHSNTGKQRIVEGSPKFGIKNYEMVTSSTLPKRGCNPPPVNSTECTLGVKEFSSKTMNEGNRQSTVDRNSCEQKVNIKEGGKPNGESMNINNIGEVGFMRSISANALGEEAPGSPQNYNETAPRNTTHVKPTNRPKRRSATGNVKSSNEEYQYYYDSQLPLPHSPSPKKLQTMVKSYCSPQKASVKVHGPGGWSQNMFRGSKQPIDITTSPIQTIRMKGKRCMKLEPMNIQNMNNIIGNREQITENSHQVRYTRTITSANSIPIHHHGISPNIPPKKEANNNNNNNNNSMSYGKNKSRVLNNSSTLGIMNGSSGTFTNSYGTDLLVSTNGSSLTHFPQQQKPITTTINTIYKKTYDKPILIKENDYNSDLLLVPRRNSIEYKSDILNNEQDIKDIKDIKESKEIKEIKEIKENGDIKENGNAPEEADTRLSTHIWKSSKREEEELLLRQTENMNVASKKGSEDEEESGEELSEEEEELMDEEGGEGHEVDELEYEHDMSINQNTLLFPKPIANTAPTNDSTSDFEEEDDDESIGRGNDNYFSNMDKMEVRIGGPLLRNGESTKNNPSSNTEKGDMPRLVPAHKSGGCIQPKRRFGGEGQEEGKESKNEGKKTYLLKSIYEGRPPTILFIYPPQCGIPRNMERAIPLKESISNNMRLKFKISDHVYTYNCVVNAFKYAGIAQTEGKNWNVLWSAPLKSESLHNLTEFQRINHFPSTWQLGRKDNLWRNVSKMKREFGDDYDICPQTYLLPEEHKRVCAEKEDDPKSLWILKPVCSSCGKGIKVIGKNNHIPKRQGYLVSRYISNPHIINGYKYDLRLYVLVTSFDPLRIYLYDNGLCRFATEKYTTSSKSTKKRYIHLTNYSVNKKAGNYQYNENSNEDGFGSKWSLLAYKKCLKEMGLNVDKIFKRVKDVIIKACIGVEPHIFNAINRATKYKNVCFELYGFDILIDANLRPWLLEVNVSPSLSSSSPLDKKIKTSLLCDVFNTIGLIAYDKRKYTKSKEDMKLQRFLGLQAKSNGVTAHSSQISQISTTTSTSIPYEKTVYKGKNINDLKVLENFARLSEDDMEMLLQFDEEFYRCGRFERIFPLYDNVEVYAKYFQCLRYNNLLLWKWLKSDHNFLVTIHKKISSIVV